MSFPSRFFDFDPFKRMGEPLMPSVGAMAPREDVSETAEGYRIEADVPGMDEKDINVTVS